MIKYVPRVWQPQISEHIYDNPRCGVFAKMGSGKTSATSIAFMAAEQLDMGPVLVLGPKRVAKNTWPKEFTKWSDLSHLTITPIMGTETQRFQALAKDTQFYTINYEMLPWLVKHLGSRWPFRTVIADESTKLKSFRLSQGSQRAGALGKVAHRYVDRFVALTGTPSPNGLKDLWGQMWFIDEGKRLGRTFEGFKERWFQRAHSGFGIDPLPFAQEQIQDAIRDVCITVDPADYMSLDKVIEADVVVELPAKARKQYVDMERQMFLELETVLGTAEVEAVNAASRTLKCLQIANGALYTDLEGNYTELHDAKLQALESIYEEACGTPILVSYQFKSDLSRILRAFPKARYFDDSAETEDAWNKGKIPMLIAHPDSAGHGSNLQYGGNILADYSSGWNLESDDQIIERIGPMRQFQSGLDRPVYRYRIMADNTVDFLVKKRRESKRTVQDILLEAMKRKT